MHDVAPPPRRAPSDGTVVLMLALNLIVLAFFLLLNSMATVSEEKVQQATLSMTTDGFTVQEAGAVLGTDSTNLNAQLWLAEAEPAARGVVQSLLPDVPEPLSASGRSLVLTLPEAIFFAPESTALKPAALGLLENLRAAVPGQVLLAVQAPPAGLGQAASRAAAAWAVLAPQGVQVGWGAVPPGGAGQVVITLTPPLGAASGAVRRAVQPVAPLGTVQGQ